MCDQDNDYRSEARHAETMLAEGLKFCEVCETYVPAGDMVGCDQCGRSVCSKCIRKTLSHDRVCDNDCELDNLEAYLTSGKIEADWRMSGMPYWKESAQAETDIVARRIEQIRDATLPLDVSLALISLKVVEEEIALPTVQKVCRDTAALIRRLIAARKAGRGHDH